MMITCLSPKSEISLSNVGNIQAFMKPYNGHASSTTPQKV